MKTKIQNYLTIAALLASPLYVAGQANRVSALEGDDEIISTSWIKNYGGADDDTLYDAVKTNDGGIIAVGTTRSNGDFGDVVAYGGLDGLMMKIDANGNLKWAKSWGGSDTDEFKKIAKTSDNNYIVIGKTSSTDIDDLSVTGSDGCIIKINDNGNILWQKAWGGSGYDEFTSVDILKDGNIIAIANVESTDVENLVKVNPGVDNDEDVALVKYDLSGNILWQKAWGGNKDDRPTCVTATSDGGIVVSGVTYSSDIPNITLADAEALFVVKFNSVGEYQWSAGRPGAAQTIDIFERSNGEIVGMGIELKIRTDPIGLVINEAMIRTDKNGNILLNKNIHNNNRMPTGGIADKDTSFLIPEGGRLSVEDDDTLTTIISRYDSTTGDCIWSHYWGPREDTGNAFSNIVQISDNEYIAIGASEPTIDESLTPFRTNGGSDALFVRFTETLPGEGEPEEEENPDTADSISGAAIGGGIAVITIITLALQVCKRR